MHSTVRITVLLVASFFALTFLLSSLVDREVLKNNLQIVINEKVEGDFSIDGEVDIKFFPSPRVIVNYPSLRNAKYDKNTATIFMRKLVVKVGFISLITRNINIDEMILVSPVLEVGFVDAKSMVKKATEVIGSSTVDEEENNGEEGFELKEDEEEKNTSDVLEEDLDDADLNITQGMVAEVKQFEDEDLSPNVDIFNNQRDQKEKKDLVYDDTKFVSRLFNFKDDDSEIFDFKRIKDIKVVNGYLFRKGLGGEVILDIKNVSFDTINNYRNQSIELNGDFLINDIPTHFEVLMNAKDGKDSKFIINSPILKLELEGEFVDSDINNLVKSSFSGTLDANIVNPKEFLNKYFSKYILIYGKVNAVTPVKIKANIESVKGDYKISDIDINSDIIKAKGFVNADLSGDETNMTSKIDIDYLDVDSIWSSRFVGHSSEIIDFEKSVMHRFVEDSEVEIDYNEIENIVDEDSKSESIFDNLKLDSEIKIKEVKYFQKTLSDIDVALSITNDNALQIERAKMTTPDGGFMEVSGSFKSQNNISNFVGSYKIDGKDFHEFLSWISLDHPALKKKEGVSYDLSGDVIMLSNFSAIKDLKISLNDGKENKSNIWGDIIYDNSRDQQNVDLKLNMDKLDFREYFDISIERNKYLLPGSLAKKLLWLNTVGDGNRISLNVEEFLFNDRKFLNQKFNFAVSPGIFVVEDLFMKSEDGEVDFSLNLMTDLKLKPKMELDLELRNFSYDSRVKEDNKKYKRLPLYARFFLLPTLVDFDGKIKIKSNSFKIDKTEFKKIDIAGSMKDGVLNIQDGIFNAYDGIFKYNGNVVLRTTKSMNGSFIFSNINNNKFFKILFGINNIGGISNMSGVINAYGKDYRAFVKSIDTKVQFLGIGVKVRKFGLSELLKRMLLAGYSKVKIDKPRLILFSKRFSTTFKNVKGSFELNPNKSINKLKISGSSVGMNCVTTGSVDLLNKKFNGLSKIIFLTGNRERQVPVNIAISHKGKMSKLKKTANLEQVDQYLRKVKSEEFNE